MGLAIARSPEQTKKASESGQSTAQILTKKIWEISKKNMQATLQAHFFTGYSIVGYSP